MRKIDLDLLLEECRYLVSTDPFVCKDCKHNLHSEPIGYCIRNVAESLVEPEIDFDALLEEYEGKVSIMGFVGFLKSKHLTVPKKFEKMSETTSVKLDCNKFKEKMGGLENDLLNAAEDNNFGKQMEIVRQISHHIRIEEFYKKIAELKEENKMLWEENRKLKGGSMLSRIVCDIATIIEHSDADSFTESIAKNLLNYINGGGR